MAPWMRAPADMVTALLGTSRALIELYDHPRDMQRLIDSLADILCDAAAPLQHHVPSFHRGHFLSYSNGICTPDRCICISEDSTSFLSDDLFKQYFLSADKKIAAADQMGPRWVSSSPRCSICNNSAGPSS